MVYSLRNTTKVGVLKTLRAGYIYLPSFQVSPEVEITFTTDGTLDYSGDLQTDYCGAEKVLYKLFFAEADVESEED